MTRRGPLRLQTAMQRRHRSSSSRRRGHHRSSDSSSSGMLLPPEVLPSAKRQDMTFVPALVGTVRIHLKILLTASYLFVCSHLDWAHPAVQVQLCGFGQLHCLTRHVLVHAGRTRSRRRTCSSCGRLFSQPATAAAEVLGIGCQSRLPRHPRRRSRHRSQRARPLLRSRRPSNSRHCSQRPCLPGRSRFPSSTSS